MKIIQTEVVSSACLASLVLILAGCSGGNETGGSVGSSETAVATAPAASQTFTPKKIETAFGTSLGAEFDPATALRASSDVPPVYEFETKTTYDAFKAYGVKITPKSRKISNIVAHGVFPDMETSEKELARLLYHLELKYGKATQGKITQGNRTIEAGIKTAGDKFMLHIEYSDLDLMKTGEDERNAKDAE